MRQGDRHSVAYIDRQVEIDNCGLCFDRNQVKVQIVGNVPVIENKSDIQPGSHIDGICVGYFEVDVVAYAVAVEVGVGSP